MRISNHGGNYIYSFFSFLLVLYAITSPVSISATNIALGLIYIVGIFWFIKRGDGCENIVFPLKIPLFCLSLFVWSAMTALITKGYVVKHDVSNFWEYSTIFILPILIKGLGAKKERIIFFLLLFSSIVCLLGIVQYLYPSVVYPFPRQLAFPRFQGFFSHPLHASGVFSITFIIGLSLLLLSDLPSRAKKLLLVFLLINGTGLLITLSRSYYISVTVAILILSASKSLKSFFYGLIALLLIMATILSFSNPIKSRVLSLSDMKFSSNIERVYMWKTALRMAKDHPFIGVGSGNWKKEAVEKYFPMIKKETGYVMPPWGHAHNSYLTWLGESGIPGLLLFLAFWYLVLKRLIEVKATLIVGSFDYGLVVGTIAALCNLFVAGLFEHNFGTSVILLLITFLIGLSLGSEKEAIRQS